MTSIALPSCSLAALTSLALLAPAAQGQGQLNARPVTTPVKDAGIFHVATGTWTRAGAGSWAGNLDVIYNNTGVILYFTTMADTTVTQFEITDSGRIPSISDVGDGDTYDVNSLLFAYCSSAGIGASLNLGYAFMIFRTADTATAVETTENLVTKLGVLLLSLGVIHFVNIAVFWKLRRRSEEPWDLPPVQATTLVPPPPPAPATIVAPA